MLAFYTCWANVSLLIGPPLAQNADYTLAPVLSVRPGSKSSICRAQSGERSVTDEPLVSNVTYND